MSVSVGGQGASTGPAVSLGPVERFEAAIEERRVSGPAVPTFAGWTLYLFVMLDAAMNVHGSGAISMLIMGTSPERGSFRGPATGTTLLISIAQLAILAVAGACLAASPWRRWLKSALEETWPALPLFRFVWPRKPNTPGSLLDTSDAIPIIRDLTLFGAFLLFLSPAVMMAFVMSNGIGLLVLGATIGLTYGMIKLVFAVLKNARADAPSAAGLIAGCVVPLLASVYASSPSTILHTTPAGLSEFTYYQLGVLSVAVVAIWLVQLGSIGDNELIQLDLGLGSTGILRDLPDMTVGAFKPFWFKVQTNGEKVVLLSRAVSGASVYRLHTTLDQHDPTIGQWSLLNLSELDRKIELDQKTEALTIEKESQSRYLKAQVNFRLATRVPEQYLNSLRASQVFIPIEDLANASFMFSGKNTTDQLREIIETTISDELDLGVQMPWKSSSALTGGLTGIVAAMRQQVSELKLALDTEVTALKAFALTGLRVDREDEIRSRVLAALERVAPFMNQVQNAYEEVSQLDPGSATLRDNLTAKLKDHLEAVKNRVAPAAGSVQRSVTIHLTDLIELTIQSVDVSLTSQAENLHKEVTSLYNDSVAYVGKKASELGDIAKEYGDIERGEFNRFFDPRTPGHIRNWALRQLLGSDASLGGGVPIFQRPATTNSGQSTVTPCNPAQGGTKELPVFDRKKAQRRAEETMPPAGGAFPD